jgi:hypothetical protein
MKKTLMVIAIIAGLLALSVVYASADAMSSDHYRITTTAISSGGAPMASAHFQINATLGQSSALIDPADPPLSAGFGLLAGFWYSLGIETPFSLCPADLEPDGDVDDNDLSTLAADFGQTVVSKDADGDLDMDGLDLYEMAIDFNRTDCMP